MSRVSRALTVLALVALPVFSAAVLADDEDTIAYRKHIMKTLDEQTAALGMILSGAVPDDNTVAHIDAIAITAATALKAFEPQVAGGDAKPEVWSNWADFSKRMNEFAQKTAEMSRVAHDKGKDEAVQMVIDALSCKSCHETYNTARQDD
jgi:cytochrome c556